MNPLYSFKIKDEILLGSEIPIWIYRSETTWYSFIGYKYLDYSYGRNGTDIVIGRIPLPHGVHEDNYELEAVPYQDHPEGYKFNILVTLKNQKPKSMQYKSWGSRRKSSISSSGERFDPTPFMENQPVVEKVVPPIELPKPDIDFTEASFVFYPADEPDVNFELRKAWLEGIIWYQNKLVKMNILADSSK